MSLSFQTNLLRLLCKVIRHVCTTVKVGIAGGRRGSSSRQPHLGLLHPHLVRLPWLHAPQLLLEEALHIRGQGWREVASKARVHASFPLHALFRTRVPRSGDRGWQRDLLSPPLLARLAAIVAYCGNVLPFLGKSGKFRLEKVELERDRGWPWSVLA